MVVWLLNMLPDLLVLLFFLTTVHVVNQPLKDIPGMDFQGVFDTLCKGLKVAASSSTVCSLSGEFSLMKVSVGEKK